MLVAVAHVGGPAISFPLNQCVHDYRPGDRCGWSGEQGRARLCSIHASARLLERNDAERSLDPCATRNGPVAGGRTLGKAAPRTDAVDGLAQIIATTPASRWSLLDARAIASRLLALLPAIPWRRPLHCLIGAARDQTHDDQGTDLGASFGGAALRTDAESLFLAPSGTAG